MDTLQKLAAEIADIARRAGNARVLAESIPDLRWRGVGIALGMVENALEGARESIERAAAKASRRAA